MAFLQQQAFHGHDGADPLELGRRLSDSIVHVGIGQTMNGCSGTQSTVLWGAVCPEKRRTILHHQLSQVPNTTTHGLYLLWETLCLPRAFISRFNFGRRHII